MGNIILYREHEMNTIIHIIITVHIYLCSANRMSGCRIIVIQSPVSATDKSAVHMRLMLCMCCYWYEFSSV